MPNAGSAVYDDAKTAEGLGLVSNQTGRGGRLQRTLRHEAPLDPKKEDDANWQDGCRKLSSRFLEDLLTRAPWREAVPFAGVRIKGARIGGNIDLANATLVRAIEIVNSRIEGAINLRHARTDSVIALDGSLMVGKFAADGLHAKSDLSPTNGAAFKSDVSLYAAKIDGIVTMTGASFGGKLIANRLQVGGSLLMRSEGENKASFKDVVLRGAKITGQIAMIGASVDGTLDANGLAGAHLLMYSDDQNKASFKDVDLRSAKITGQIDVRGACFEGALTAEGLQAGGDLCMYDAHFAHEVYMVFAHVGGTLDLRGSTLAGLNLSGASIAEDLALSGSYKPAVWKAKNGEPGALTMRNAHIGNLMDAKNAWPARGHLLLDGFSFNHLGGFAGETGPEMRARGMKWWDNWARRDPGYSPALYAQLAAALTSAGDRDAANEIRFLGRVRERETQTELPTFGLDSFSMSPASVSAPTPSALFGGCSASPSPARRYSGGPSRRRA